MSKPLSVLLHLFIFKYGFYPRYFIRMPIFPDSLSLVMLFSLIWRTRSRVNPILSPISSSPFSVSSIPKQAQTILRSLSLRHLLRTCFSSCAILSWSTCLSVRLSSPLDITSAIELSSSSPNGASMLTWCQLAMMLCVILSSSTPVLSEIS